MRREIKTRACAAHMIDCVLHPERKTEFIRYVKRTFYKQNATFESAIILRR